MRRAGERRRVLGHILFGAALVVATAAFAIQREPDVRIVRPQEGERVSGNAVLVEVEYQTNTDRPIECVEIWIDGRKDYTHWLDRPEMSGTKRYQWDSTRFSSGRHSIQARARDQLGYEGTALVNILAGAPAAEATGVTPYITVFSPRDGETVGGQQRIQIDVHGGSPQWVLLLVDGKHLALTTRAPYNVIFDTTEYDNGAHTIQAIAKTGSGEIESPVIRVQVQNPGGGQFTVLEPPSVEAPGSAAETPLIAESASWRTPPSAAPPLGGPAALDFGLSSPVASEALVITTPSERPAAPAAAAPATPAQPSRTPESVSPAPLAPVEQGALRSSDGEGAVLRGSGRGSASWRTPEAASPVPAVERPGVPEPPQLSAEASRGVSAESTAVRELRVAALPELPQPRPRAVAPSPEQPAIEPPSRPTAVVSSPVREDGVRVPSAEPPALAPPEAPEPATQIAAAVPVAARSVREATATPPVRPMAWSQPTPLAIPKSLARVHLVRVGETLWGLGRRYHVSVARISRANSLDPDAHLRAGSRIIVPPATTVLLDDVPIEFDVAPEVLNDVTMAPIRHMIETAGGEVYWHPKDQRVTGQVGGTTVEVQVGSRIAKINEDQVLLSIAAFLKNNRVLVPVRFVGQVLQATVRYDPETENVRIVTAKQ